MDLLLTPDTPTPVYDAVSALMSAETGRGPSRFLHDVRTHLPNLPDWNTVPGTALHPLDEAIDLAIFFTRIVAEEADARRWKSAARELKFVRHAQEMYWVRMHIEDLEPIPGYIVRGHVVLGETLMQIYSADPDVRLFNLPPTSSQEAIQAAITAWTAGYKQGARHGMKAIRSMAAWVEGGL